MLLISEYLQTGIKELYLKINMYTRVRKIILSLHSLPGDIYPSYELKWMYLLTSTAFSYVKYGGKQKSFAYIFEWTKESANQHPLLCSQIFLLKHMNFILCACPVVTSVSSSFFILFLVFSSREVWNSLLFSRW